MSKREDLPTKPARGRADHGWWVLGVSVILLGCAGLTVIAGGAVVATWEFMKLAWHYPLAALGFAAGGWLLYAAVRVIRFARVLGEW